jgi:oligoribonuclease NrnB/cAMP/cGMP phosphodiesterase (DHH superfamily)
MKHVIIHHTDADGHCSAAVVFHALIHNAKIPRSDITFVSTNYGQKLDLQTFDQKNDIFYMVDFSVQPEEDFLKFVKATPHFVWIDHHDTALTAERNHPELKSLPGLRFSDRGAACLLCWRHYFGDEPVPLLVELVSKYDIWDRTDARYWEDSVLPLNYALMSFDSRPFKAIDWWDQTLRYMRKDPTEANKVFDDHVLEGGRSVLQYARKSDDRMVQGNAFKGTFAGHSALFFNGTGNSTIYERVFNPRDYDLLVMFKNVKGQYWTVSLYTYREGVDCGKLAERIGSAGPIPSGGGHMKAAGFQTTWDYFAEQVRLENGEKIR